MLLLTLTQPQLTLLYYQTADTVHIFDSMAPTLSINPPPLSPPPFSPSSATSSSSSSSYTPKSNSFKGFLSFKSTTHLSSLHKVSFFAVQKIQKLETDSEAFHCNNQHDHHRVQGRRRRERGRPSSFSWITNRFWASQNCSLCWALSLCVSLWFIFQISYISKNLYVCK